MKALIARAFLADEMADGALADSLAWPQQLGSVVLHPHQILAIRRIRSALHEFGGALLADEVGMGKTFVALAVARQFQRPVVAAPAALRDMWRYQGELAAVELPFISIESLSRGKVVGRIYDLVIIDEAHHVRNPATRRYRELARIAARARVLMLSATPVHNSRRDLTATLAVFLGSHAASLSTEELSRCVIRRNVEAAQLKSAVPYSEGIEWREVTDDATVPAALLSLPPPLPARGGGIAAALVARSLIRQWCSSEAALKAAIRRRLAKSIALSSALESGQYPSQSELSAWTVADDSVQLAFPSIVATSVARSPDLIQVVDDHRQALRNVMSRLDAMHSRDRERAALIRDIRHAHPELPVVAFSQYSETVLTLFRELRDERGVAVLTARGARVAGGSISRREALDSFAPRARGVSRPRDVERIDLLLATDLLSEGINLQDAAVVVHLDLPWTAARLDQRMGRVARMGSIHSRVYAYGIRPPGAAEALIGLEATIAAKTLEMEGTVGRFSPGPVVPLRLRQDAALTEEPRHEHGDRIATGERIRNVMRGWLSAGFRGRPQLIHPPGAISVSSAVSGRAGFIALCRSSSRDEVLFFDEHRVLRDPVEILDLVSRADGGEVCPRTESIARALELTEVHLRAERIVGVTGPQSASPARARSAALHRVSQIVEHARPHVRSRLLELAVMARLTLGQRTGIASERGLMALAGADVPDEEWLTAIANYGDDDDTERRTDADVASVENYRVTGLLLLEPTRP